MILPSILLLVLSICSYYLPPESGERVTVVSTNLLTMAIFLLMTNDVLPNTSDSVSVISIFYVSLMCESGLSLLMSHLILSIHHRSELSYCTRY